jgi:hypothetical protein
MIQAIVHPVDFVLSSIPKRKLDEFIMCS